MQKPFSLQNKQAENLLFLFNNASSDDLTPTLTEYTEDDLLTIYTDDSGNDYITDD